MGTSHRYLEKKSPGSLKMADFHKRPSCETECRLRVLYPDLAKVKDAREGDESERALHDMYTSTYNAHYDKRCYKTLHCLPPTTYESSADPVAPPRRQFLPPKEKVLALRDTPGNDGHRGWHEWRQLTEAASTPGYACWPPLQRVPILPTIDRSSALPPASLPSHNPVHEKQRWDALRTLDHNDGLSYGYRKNLPGYAGHTFDMEHVCSPVAQDLGQDNTAMLTTTQANYTEPPTACYQKGRNTDVSTTRYQYCHGPEVTCRVPLPPVVCTLHEPTPGFV